MSDEDQTTIGTKRPRDPDFEIVTTEEIEQRLHARSPDSSPNDSLSGSEEEDEGESPKRFCLDVAEATTEEFESEDEEEDTAGGQICPLCEHATSEIVRDLTTLADKLAGRASQQHVTSMQLKIFEKRVAPLRWEGRTNIPNITRYWLHKHYNECRISPMRSVSQDIRMFEEAETLLRTNLTDVDDEGTTVLSSRTASELCRLSKGKMDALKFFHQLSKERELKEANEKKS